MIGAELKVPSRHNTYRQQTVQQNHTKAAKGATKSQQAAKGATKALGSTHPGLTLGQCQLLQTSDFFDKKLLSLCTSLTQFSGWPRAHSHHVAHPLVTLHPTLMLIVCSPSQSIVYTHSACEALCIM